MRLTKMAQQILAIREQIDSDEEFDIYDFDQTWGSTALGFSGIGGSAITTERTYVLVPYDKEVAYVFFGSQFAYKCGINDAFRYDIRHHSMASVITSGRYGKYED